MALSKYARQLNLRETTFAALKEMPVGKAAKADGLSFKDTRGTTWWVIELDGEPVGVCGLIQVRAGVLRLKSAFIVPEWRRQGLYTVAAWLRMIEARRRGAEWVETIARSSSGEALCKIGFHGEEGKAPNFYHMNIKNLFTGADLDRPPIELLLELCPEVRDGT